MKTAACVCGDLLASSEQVVAATGIDVGATKIAAGRLSSTGERILVAVSRTARGDGARNVAVLQELLELRELRDAVAIGISVAMTIDAEGRMRDSANWFGWDGKRLTDELQTGTPSLVLHDALSGAIGEYRMGAGRGAEDMLFISLGTGLSHCMIENGEPLLGAHGSAFLSGYGLAARCSWNGCLQATVEDICSGPAIAAAYAEVPGATNAETVMEQAERGEERAEQVLSHAAWHFGAYVADLVQQHDPEVVVVGGGLGSGASRYREEAISVARELIRPPHLKAVIVRRAELGPDASWVGAADQALRILGGCPTSISNKEPRP